MLPAPGGAAAETTRPDVKGRWDCPMPGVFEDTLRFAIRRGVWWYGISYPPLDRTLIGVYEPGDHFAWHRDDMIPATANRQTAISIMLNDPSEYEGGALELPEYGLTLRPPKGALVAFPASALHRVTPITAGERKVLLTFILKETV